MKSARRVATCWLIACSVFLAATGLADVERRAINDGNLVLEDVPQIPQDIVDDLNRYQNVRSASVLDWSKDGKSLFVSTRFAEVSQIHRVDRPLGARRQLTFFDEPVGSVVRRPGGSDMLFTRDAGGSEFAQIFSLDPGTGSYSMLTDGESRNGAIVWDRDGRQLAFQSTRRNGASNDVWIMDPVEPANARMVLESPDGSWWGPQEFSESGSQVLVSNYISITDSRVHLLDLDTGQHERLAGGTRTSANFPVGFDRESQGFWFITDAGSEFQQLAWQAFDKGAQAEIVSGDIHWNVSGAALSHDRKRMAFVVNENGLARLYLMDTATREYRPVDGIPTGLIYGLRFSPDDRKLAMTINSAKTPSDAFVLALGSQPLQHASLERWTESEVGGLDTSAFIEPELITFPTFDEVDGQARQIPAWLYRPPGKGPHPVIVSIHGGPEGQARPWFSSTYQIWLAKLGAAVVVPNVRGSAGYGKTYLGLDNGFRREDSVRDIGALLDWIDSEPGLDASRVGVSGGSYGGYMVLASAVHYSDRLIAAVDRVGISNFVTFLENTQDYRRDLRRAEYGDERDPAMRKFLNDISPLNNVSRISVPMLIVQGENDPRVPVSESIQIVAALREQGHSVWYMNALNEGHGYRKKENRDAYQQAAVLFFREHLIGKD